jgi:DNA-binding winged helix-turn-helix (wHTH) protein
MCRSFVVSGMRAPSRRALKNHLALTWGTSASIEFRILGSVEVVGDEGPLALGAPKQRALLALLLLNANTVVSRDRLVDALWGAEPPRSAVSSLQVYVHGLRRALGRTDEGRAALTESVALARRLGYREVLAYCLGGLAELAVLEEDAERAATMLGASEHLFHEIGAALDPEEMESQERIEGFAGERLGPARVEELRGAGAALTLDELLEDVASRA